MTTDEIPMTKVTSISLPKDQIDRILQVTDETDENGFRFEYNEENKTLDLYEENYE